MAVSWLQLGGRWNVSSILPRLLALAWSAYCVQSPGRSTSGHRARPGTCLPVSLAMVSTATTNAEENAGAPAEKKND